MISESIAIPLSSCIFGPRCIVARNVFYDILIWSSPLISSCLSPPALVLFLFLFVQSSSSCARCGDVYRRNLRLTRSIVATSLILETYKGALIYEGTVARRSPLISTYVRARARTHTLSSFCLSFARLAILTLSSSSSSRAALDDLVRTKIVVLVYRRSSHARSNSRAFN